MIMHKTLLQQLSFELPNGTGFKQDKQLKTTRKACCSTFT